MLLLEMVRGRKNSDVIVENTSQVYLYDCGNNIYMIELNCYKCYQNQPSSSMWKSIPFGFIKSFCRFDPTIS